MRSELKPFENQICSGNGTIREFGFKNLSRKRRLSFNTLMILIAKVKINGEIDIDHLWVNSSHAVNLSIGDEINFLGKIIMYTKRDKTVDYTFEEIYDVERILPKSI